MNRCPITYSECSGKYSLEGIALLASRTNELKDFPYGISEQMELALEFSDKLSIQGVQPKLSAVFDEEVSCFKPVSKNGLFILKLPHRNFDQLPQNEDLTMRLAKICGVDIPFHGMIYAIDGSLLYFIERFDRRKEHPVQNLEVDFPQARRKRKKLHKISVEDFAQLSGLSRESKYDSSMEKIAAVIETHCSFPLAEKKKLFRLTVFSFLAGNEDLHVKNFSLVRHADLVELSPAYDLLNTSIVVGTKEELALPLRGKKSNFSRNDLVVYYGVERLGLPGSVIEEVLEPIRQQIPACQDWIGKSFLAGPKKAAYLELFKRRCSRLFE